MLLVPLVRLAPLGLLVPLVRPALLALLGLVQPAHGLVLEPVLELELAPEPALGLVPALGLALALELEPALLPGLQLQLVAAVGGPLSAFF